MDLRVYVDGVARIICDLTRTTTVHDIIIALAQYKGKAGRYSLIEQAPNGAQRTLSPTELTCELIHHTDWAYILQQNPSIRNRSPEKRSKSLDGRKTPLPQQQQSVLEIPAVVTSSNRHRTVNKNHHPAPATISSSSSSARSTRRPVRPHVRHVFPAINTNNSNNNLPHELSAKRPSRTSNRLPVDGHGTGPRRSRPKSALPSSISENSAFHIVHHPSNHQLNQQQQYLALLQMLRTQEQQVEQQKKELSEKEQEIQYREALIHQNQREHENIQGELQRLEEHDRRLVAECQFYAQEYSPETLKFEFDYQEQLHSNYEHLQQQLTRCSSVLEQQRLAYEQMQLNLEQTQKDTEQVQNNANSEKKEIAQCQQELEQSNAAMRKQQEDLGHWTHQRHQELERLIQDRQEKILELESQLIQFDDPARNRPAHSSYCFHSTSPTPDMLLPVHLQLMNTTLWKLSPSGIWV